MAIRTRRIGIIGYDHVQGLDLNGPLDVFSIANHISGRSAPPYEPLVLGVKRGTFRAESGAMFVPHELLDSTKALDTLIIPGGRGMREMAQTRAKIARWLQDNVHRVRRIASICTGLYALAESKLLDGRRATTHWKFGREMATRYPAVRVEHEPLWVKDGNIYTSAGISAGIDLALAWVEEDCGAALAHEAARELVLFLRRPGGQPQVSVSLASQASEMASIRELQIWIADHLATRLSVEHLARRMRMSVRTFERVFTREVGTTPSHYVLQMRVEAARRLLERTDGGLKHVASAVGFGSVDVMRRAFVRLLGTTPRRYRAVAEPTSS
jgi:transcriptional regulator GlxA family with amidase domain